LPYAATRLRQKASPGKAPFVSAPFDRSQALFEPALPSRFTPDAAASTASRPASLTIRTRPSSGTGWEEGAGDSGVGSREISENRHFSDKRGYGREKYQVDLGFGATGSVSHLFDHMGATSVPKISIFLPNTNESSLRSYDYAILTGIAQVSECNFPRISIF